MKRLLFWKSFVLLCACAITTLGEAQTMVSNTTSADAEAIRNLVAQENEGKPVLQYTDNRIFVSGAFPRPLIGQQMRAADQQRREQMQKERLNYSQKSRIERLEVAQAGDMAYEFGYADLSWDSPDKKHTAFEASYLRVWRKVAGAWKVDVFFARPNDGGPSSNPK